MPKSLHDPMMEPLIRMFSWLMGALSCVVNSTDIPINAIPSSFVVLTLSRRCGFVIPPSSRIGLIIGSALGIQCGVMIRMVLHRQAGRLTKPWPSSHPLSLPPWLAIAFVLPRLQCPQMKLLLQLVLAFIGHAVQSLLFMGLALPGLSLCPNVRTIP